MHIVAPFPPVEPLSALGLLPAKPDKPMHNPFALLECYKPLAKISNELKAQPKPTAESGCGAEVFPAKLLSGVYGWY